MRLSIEQRGRIVILRCAGTHACSDEDHAALDEAVGKLSNVLCDGQSLLLDVRKLHVVYPSGIAEMLNPWAPETAGWNPNDGARVGFLYEEAGGPGEKGWRLTSLALDVARTLSREREGPRWLGFFTDESEALSFLASGETPGGPAPRPTPGG